jgi:NAD(P)-dependent dehydrogenase (short-subunit alcohol dehydrogenase family)
MNEGMGLQGSVAFVTGGNRGLGRAFVETLLARGAAKVYAAARQPKSVDIPGAVPIQVDVADPGSVARAAHDCGDVTLLVNNAGIALTTTDSLDPAAVDISRETFETNYLGVMRASQAFAPVILANGGGGIVNVLSDQAWFSRPFTVAYAASKSAAWSYTNALRMDLAPRGVRVLGLHVGFIDTDMVSGLEVRKSDPAVVAGHALDGLAAGLDEVLADDQARLVKGSLSESGAYYLVPADMT